MTNEKVYSMHFSKLYPCLLAKVEKKGRTRAELDQAICWFTGYSSEMLDQLVQSSVSYGEFFRAAPCLNPCRELITGVVCGVRVEDVGEPLMREIRRLDKLVDELARGKSMEKILRRPAD